MSQLAELARRLFSRGGADKMKILDTEKRIRGFFAAKVIFDTTKAKLVWEHKYFPQYWVPKSSLTEIVAVEDRQAVSGTDLFTESIKVDDRTVPALVVPSSFDGELAGYAKFDFDALDQWLEEQSQIIFHPRDPFHRVDVLPTSRRIQVEIDGVLLADTRLEGGVMSLWETSFPARWYLPRTAVNWEYLTESPTKTGCPYKGKASYYHAVINGKRFEDVVWWYEFPLRESILIQGMLCFYPDKVDMSVDGEKRERKEDMFPRAKKEIGE